MLANYLCELTLLEYSFINYLPSTIAAAAVSLALHTFGRPAWNANLSHYTGVSPNNVEMRNCLQELYTQFVNVYTNQCTLQAVKEKYSHSKFMRVSATQPPTNLPIF